jgi:iron complex outermembrane receptor protein
VYRAAHGEYYARYARGFNLPGVWSAIFFDSFYGRGDEWRNLEAELIDHLEIGLSRNIGRAAKLDLAVFTSDVSHGLRFLPPPPFPPTFDNIDDYTSEGAEAALTFSAKQAIHLLFAATYSRTDPENIPYTPEWTFTGGLSARLAPRWRLHADMEWIDERMIANPRFGSPGDRVDSFFLLNGRLAWKLSSTGEDARGTTVFLAFENLLDEDYSFRAGYPMPGTSVMLGLDWRPGS